MRGVGIACTLAAFLVLAGCSAEWRSENRDQELWWNMAERGPIALVRTDPFACSGDAYSCHVASREYLAELCDQQVNGIASNEIPSSSANDCVERQPENCGERGQKDRERRDAYPVSMCKPVRHGQPQSQHVERTRRR